MILLMNGSPISILCSISSGARTMISIGRNLGLAILEISAALRVGEPSRSIMTRISRSLSRVGSPHALEPKRIIFSGWKCFTIFETISERSASVTSGTIRRAASVNLSPPRSLDSRSGCGPGRTGVMGRGAGRRRRFSFRCLCQFLVLPDQQAGCWRG